MAEKICYVRIRKWRLIFVTYEYVNSTVFPIRKGSLAEAGGIATYEYVYSTFFLKRKENPAETGAVASGVES